MALRARKVSGAFEKRTPGHDATGDVDATHKGTNFVLCEKLNVCSFGSKPTDSPANKDMIITT